MSLLILKKNGGEGVYDGWREFSWGLKWIEMVDRFLLLIFFSFRKNIL